MAQNQCDTTGHTYPNEHERTCTYCGAVRDLPPLPMPATVNGYPVVAFFAIPDRDGCKRGRCMIMADRLGGPQRWVVAMHVRGEDGWHQGDYVADLERALVRLDERTRIALGLPTGQQPLQPLEETRDAAPSTNAELSKALGKRATSRKRSK